jgi:hypothetical protein
MNAPAPTPKPRVPTARSARIAATWPISKKWTSAHGETWLPATPRTVADYVSELAETLRPSTIIRRVAAIAVYHQLAGVDSPTSHSIVKAVLKGIRRKLGVAQRFCRVKGRARVKVSGTVSPLVSDPVGVTPPVGRIVVQRTDLSRRRASALCGSCA